MPDVIDRFSGKYRFLSNFYPCDISYKRRRYKSVEHAFQAAKTERVDWQKKIKDAATPSEAKQLGNRAPKRPEWEDIKITVMTELIWEKFKNTGLRKQLLDTGNAFLVEGNWWNDTFWGVCRERGENHLGRILMKTRKEIRDGEEGKDKQKQRKKG